MAAMPRVGFALLLLAVAALAAGCGRAGADASPSGVAGSPSEAIVSVAPGGPTAPPGMAVVAVTDLPPEAATTLGRIAAGGPFPYRQDGVTFENREGLLPARSSGFYREYTVPTPGSTDRGARRIITGANGERYWTADHYDSFAWITP